MSKTIDVYSRAALSEILGLTPERIRQLVHEGMPHVMRDGKTVYVPRDCVRWLRDRDRLKAQLSITDGVPKEAVERARKLKAEADIKEMELAQMRGDMIPADEFQQMCDALVGGFASVATSRLQQFERRIVQATTPADARRLTHAMTGALLQGARDYGEELEAEAESA